MSDFKSRLIDEKTQLNEKIIKLKSFLKSKEVSKIDNIQRDLLTIQFDAMTTYLRILIVRIKG